MSSSQYEREFKNILEGDKNILSKITKTCTAIEKDNYLCIRNKPFIVVRAAGSFGVDLVALRGDISFLIEIKTSIHDTLHFSSVGGKLQRQLKGRLAQTYKNLERLWDHQFDLKKEELNETIQKSTHNLAELTDRLFDVQAKTDKISSEIENINSSTLKRKIDLALLNYQEKTFKKDEMSMAEYHKAMYEYEKRLTEIRKGIARLRARRAGVRTIKSEIQDLEDELKSINELMKETQRSYFHKGEINRKTYEGRMSQFRERITEINGNLAMLKMKQNEGKNK